MHGNIIGQSLSGKTWLAEYMGRKLSRDVNVVVYSPHYFGGSDFLKQFGAVAAFNDKKEFLRYVYSHTDLIIFIDEAADAFLTDIDRRLMTQGRHWGHQIFLISQRYNRLDKTMRDQGDIIFCFQVDIKDSRELAEAYINENMLESYKLSKCHCNLSIKSEPESQKQIFTRDLKDMKEVDKICRRLILEAPEPNTELMKSCGICQGDINWEFLEQKGYIYAA